jgi:hypothetical protein
MILTTRTAGPIHGAARNVRRSGPLARAIAIATTAAILVVSPLAWGAWVARDWTVITIDIPGILALVAIVSALAVALTTGDELSDAQILRRLPHTPDVLSGCGPA